MESFNEQVNREKRQNNTLKKWGKRNGLSNAEINRRIAEAHARRGSRNANLTVGAIKRKIGGSRKIRRNRRK
jgi:hypothetical protein